MLNCYDDHNELLNSERYIREQNALPIKLDFKSTSMIHPVIETTDKWIEDWFDSKLILVFQQLTIKKFTYSKYIHWINMEIFTLQI